MGSHYFARCISALLLTICVLMAQSAANGQAPEPQSSAPSAANSSSDSHPVLVELFTSEGCSSCPPADILLQKLDEFQPIPGAELIVLSEHVTYWDQQGWKDPNSSPVFTDRQSSYEAPLGEQQVFTPQLIVDGTHEIRMDRLRDMEDVLQRARDTAKVPVRIGELKVDPANPTILQTRIETGDNFDHHNADVFIAVALNQVESQVLKGENGGKHLVHVAVVQQLTKVGKLPKGKTFAQDVQLKLKPGTDLKNVRVVAFVQESGPGKLLGAALRKSSL
ncbi:MAG TPA: DUF1223 domain-containing protein [Candidatus Sulfotelmatobacter sp.]|nr:DUF1223 domain-containing protein [Candidatus Sulfotelmatobacter sp.]